MHKKQVTMLKIRLADYMTEIVMSVREKMIQEPLNKLIQRNCELVGTHQLTFTYGGKRYSMAGYHYDSSANRTLHPSLQHEVHKLVIDDSFDCMHTKTQVQMFFQRVFSFANIHDEVYELIPPHLHKHLHDVQNTLIDVYISDDMRNEDDEYEDYRNPPEEVEAFKNKNQALYATVNRMVLEGLMFN